MEVCEEEKEEVPELEERGDGLSSGLGEMCLGDVRRVLEACEG
jgi:hypothetical protein